MNRGKPQDDSLFELCKLQAATAGAFSEVLLRHFYETALQRCAKFIGWESPARQIRETVAVSGDGSIQLSEFPSSEVTLMAGAQVIDRLPKPERRRLEPGHRAWCCHYYLQAIYTVGVDLCDVDCLPADFKQAVCRVFAYLVENRGESVQDSATSSRSDVVQSRDIMTRSGARDFLRSYLTTVL